MFCLHGNGWDQTWPHCNWAVSLLIFSVHIIYLERFPSCLTTFCVASSQIQLQEAHWLQEEETAASNKETTLPAPSSDYTQGQLSTPWTFEPFNLFLYPHPAKDSKQAPPIQRYYIRVVFIFSYEFTHPGNTQYVNQSHLDSIVTVLFLFRYVFIKLHTGCHK